MNIRRKSLTALSLAMLVGSQFDIVVAQTQPRNECNIRAALFGLHSLAAGRTARLNVVNAVLGAPPADGHTAKLIRLILTRSVG